MVQADVPVIISHVANTLADMETLFPAWDLNINRHMVYHIAEHLAISGPLWPLTMFPSNASGKPLVTLCIRPGIQKATSSKSSGHTSWPYTSLLRELVSASLAQVGVGYPAPAGSGYKVLLLASPPPC